MPVAVPAREDNTSPASNAASTLPLSAAKVRRASSASENAGFPAVLALSQAAKAISPTAMQIFFLSFIPYLFPC